MKTILWILIIVPGIIFSACKKDDDTVKENLFENGKLNLKYFASTLPKSAEVSVGQPYENTDSYFTARVREADMLNGQYPGWCIETGVGIKPHHKNTVSVYSSYEILTGYDKIFLNRLNWLLNQELVKHGFTYGEVQIALWVLKHGYTVFNEDVSDELNNTRPPNLFDPESTGGWEWEKVNEILTRAAGIDDFIPGAGGIVAIILIDPENQDVAVEYKLPSE
jgi:hypothetical protein